MTGRDLLDPDAHGPADGDEEQELRFLLRRAVPDLDAPEDRIDRIRARAARTRSRRRAATVGAGLTGGLVAAALAAAPALAPAPDRGPATGPVGTPSAVSPLPPAPPGDPGAVLPSGTAIRFPALPDVVVDVPNGWHTRDGVTGDPREGIGFLATHPLDGKSSCPEAGLCVPVGPLTAGGAFVALQLIDDQARIDQTPTPAGPGTLTEGTPKALCTMYGGTRELTGHRVVVRDGRPALIELTACLREPSDRTLRQVRQVLDSLRTTAGGGSTPAKTPRG
ncbi:hypothetical protein ACFWP2_12285 [Kitasatospora sp. NPDC058444]|uniref:hypothetical protein n=1 Tax=Kitasatospora sp. NPDC058444 TaxID=3346504 RepID=UPI0036586554